jgi:hypothetical protein
MSATVCRYFHKKFLGASWSLRLDLYERMGSLYDVSD